MANKAANNPVKQRRAELNLTQQEAARRATYLWRLGDASRTQQAMSARWTGSGRTTCKGSHGH
nr:hypothetical protein [Kibdelosporangium sp. MJ126-NF4]CTQ94916.1 hypothetical protein [Kibdelosporangium sp. MJ126-NF4]